ncbi:MAG TPA: MarR family transcriptional regulator [Gaiellaceae bacterium]|nr:MarR family transcriptional regulator [Gaiellaceae bacterium]
MSELLQSEISVSIPREQLVTWRSFLEGAYAVIDILDAELQADGGLSLRWYDVLVQLEEAGEAEESVGMTELANRILFSKSGLTRVVDRMEEAGLVRRERPPADRRAVHVVITQDGLEALREARVVHRRGIQEHFLRHLDSRDVKALERIFGKVRGHVRPLRPGRISG